MPILWQASCSRLARVKPMKTSAVLLGITLAFAATAPAQAQARAPATTVAFRNDLPGAYTLQRVRLYVDGRMTYDGPHPFAGAALPSGAHVVSVVANYQMKDPLLRYVNGYSIELRAAERIESSPPRAILASAVERGDATTPVVQRAQIVWR